MAELTDSLSVWAEWVKDYLNDATWRDAAGIKMVMYGDQEKIPVVPLVCVEPSDKRREFNGVPRRTAIGFELFILIYYGTIQDTQANLKQCMDIAEAVEARLHHALTCDGLVINSLVTNVTPGASNKGGAMMRATRLTFTAESRINLPMGV